MTFVKLVFRPQRVIQRLLPGEEKLLNEERGHKHTQIFLVTYPGSS